VERVAQEFPDDPFVRENLISLQRDADDLEAQWAAQARSAQQEVCRYRMIPVMAGHYALRHVTKSLLDFQELFSQVVDALENGVKKRARLSEATADETAFEFAFSYAGSLGIALSIQSQMLLFEGRYDRAVEAFMQVVDSSSEDDVRELAATLGQAVVKRTFDWSLVNVDANYSVDLRWTNLAGHQRGGMIGLSTFNRLASIIGRTSDETRTTFVSDGILLGLDTQTRRFRIADQEATYAGALSSSFSTAAVWHINARYRATLVSQETTEYATENVRQQFFLERLEPLQS
jgi:hypothetical protein